MPIALFDHQHEAVFLSAKKSSASPHSIGGDPQQLGIEFRNGERGCRVVASIDLSFLELHIPIPGITTLPLIHGFQYCTNGFEFIYRLTENNRVEMLSHDESRFTANFPYNNYPDSFQYTPVEFRRHSLNRSIPTELEKYRVVFDSEVDTDENLFSQDSPSDRCTYAKCSSPIDREWSEILGFESRVPSLNVIALHSQDDDDHSFWGDSTVQLIFQICKCCHSVVVTNQCG